MVEHSRVAGLSLGLSGSGGSHLPLGRWAWRVVPELSLLIACGISVIALVVAVEQRVWACWWSWTGTLARVLAGAWLILIVGCGSGLLAWGVGQGTGASTGSAVVDGFVFGFAAAALVRVEGIPARVEVTGGYGNQVQSNGGTLLRRALEWASNALDDELKRRAERHFRGLSEEHLRGVTIRLLSEAAAEGPAHESWDLPKKTVHALEGSQPLGSVMRANAASFCAVRVVNAHLKLGDVQP